MNIIILNSKKCRKLYNLTNNKAKIFLIFENKIGISENIQSPTLHCDIIHRYYANGLGRWARLVAGGNYPFNVA